MRPLSTVRFFPFAAWSVALGIIVPVLLEAVWWVSNRHFSDIAYSLFLERLTLLLWLTSLPFMLGPVWTPITFLISVLGNALLYLVAGAVFWLGLTRHRAFLALPIVVIASVWWWLWSF